jgi:N-acetylmuramic acid 6-phosphate etherase
MNKTDIRKLGTEQRNRAAKDLDKKSARQIAAIINREDSKVAKAVSKALPQIAKAIDAIANGINKGGRLIYVGAGTSGRIAALDASECPPTFNISPKTVQYVIAGGDQALAAAAEYNEDSRAQGSADMAAREPGPNDVVVGIAASGRTPYTIAAVEYARQRGAKTVAVVCNKRSELGQAADIEIAVDVGPEVVSGSTRMKAGTAQKMILNMLTTGAFTRLGYVYGNLMVNVHLKNEKLAERGIGVLMEAANCERKAAEGVLAASDNQVAVALVMLKAKVNATEAQRRLQTAKQNVRRAIAGKS